MRIDPSGQFFLSALLIGGLLVGGALLFSGCTSNKNDTKPSIKYDAPLYKQGNTNLCWAYCQTMIESYQNNTILSKKEANEQAKKTAIDRYGEKNWNQGGFPSNAGEEIGKDKINNIDDLYNMLVDNGPIYACYSAQRSAHLVVVTGVDPNKDIVYTNNPWGIKGSQSFNEFKSGVAKKWWQSSQNLSLYCIYLID